MAGETRKLTVSLSPAAVVALHEIWQWNAENYGTTHADRYIAFLKSEMNKLGGSFHRGKPVPASQMLFYLVLRKRQSGHGHLVIFEITDRAIHVLRFYHTAQDWQNKLADDPI